MDFKEFILRLAALGGGIALVFHGHPWFALLCFMGCFASYESDLDDEIEEHLRYHFHD